jgi:hypothetical protein
VPQLTLPANKASATVPGALGAEALGLMCRPGHGRANGVWRGGRDQPVATMAPAAPGPGGEAEVAPYAQREQLNEYAD